MTYLHNYDQPSAGKLPQTTTGAASGNSVATLAIPELLAPAGNREAFLIALQNGADAIYLGIENFNARRNATNFSLTELRELCDLAHLADAKLFLTLNIAILEQEFAAALEIARQAWYAGVDAVIVQDLGLMMALARELPQLKLHASTQINAHSSAAVRYLANIGASRVTLARELSLQQITTIVTGEKLLVNKCDAAYDKTWQAERDCSIAQSEANEQKGTGVDIEVFAHGALCVCYSGNCLMSSLIGQRSANRGLCAQPCRLPYQLIDTSTGRRVNTSGKHLLSPLDLATIDMLPELTEAGIASLKIEGRMKDAAYVGRVTQVYRAALDALADGKKSPVDTTQVTSLKQVYTRGFTQGYLRGIRDNALMGYNQPNNRGAQIFYDALSDNKAEVDIEPSTGKKTQQAAGANAAVSANGIETNITCDHLFSGNQGWRLICCHVTVVLGAPINVTFIDRQSGVSSSASGAIVEAAKSRALSHESIREHVGRIGGTPFSICDWNIELSDNVGIGFSALHSLRRKALDELIDALLEPWHRRRLLPAPKKHAAKNPANRGTPFVSALVRDSVGARAAHKAGATMLYAHTLNFNVDEKALGLQTSEQYVITHWLPTISTNDELAEMFSCLDAQNITRAKSDRQTSKRPAFVANNLGELEYARQLIAAQATSNTNPACVEIGPSLPAYNRATLEHYANIGSSRVWLSPELSLNDLEQIAVMSPVPLGIIVSGAQELMVTEHCVLMAQGDCNRDCNNCARRAAPRLLEDRKGYRFGLRTDNKGRSHIFNAITLDIVHEMPRLLALGITGFMVDCTLLNSAQITTEVERAVRACKLAINGTGQLSKRENTTTGHLFRGVL